MTHGETEVQIRANDLGIYSFIVADLLIGKLQPQPIAEEEIRHYRQGFP